MIFLVLWHTKLQLFFIGFDLGASFFAELSSLDSVRFAMPST